MTEQTCGHAYWLEAPIADFFTLTEVSGRRSTRTYSSRCKPEVKPPFRYPSSTIAPLPYSRPYAS